MCTTIHIKAQLSQESTQQDINIQPCNTSESQLKYGIKDNTVSNSQDSCFSPLPLYQPHGSIYYPNMTIAEIVHASR